MEKETLLTMVKSEPESSIGIESINVRVDEQSVNFLKASYALRIGGILYFGSIRLQPESCILWVETKGAGHMKNIGWSVNIDSSGLSEEKNSRHVLDPKTKPILIAIFRAVVGHVANTLISSPVPPPPHAHSTPRDN